MPMLLAPCTYDIYNVSVLWWYGTVFLYVIWIISTLLLPFLHGASTPCDLLDQEFLVYFQKRTKIVRAKPDDHYRVYSIPINSAIKFVPLHKEDAKFTRAAWEGDFDNVADIAKLTVFPLVSTHACIHPLSQGLQPTVTTSKIKWQVLVTASDYFIPFPVW